MVSIPTTNQMTAITNVRIFDGENVPDYSVVVFSGEQITALGGDVPAGATVIEGNGATLLPGLIDSHVHTDFEGLRDALKFGVTTEMDMQGHWPIKKRQEVAARYDIADVRSPGMGVTPKGGHPTQYMSSNNLLIRLLMPFIFKFVQTPAEAVKFVDRQIANGADYIKIFIEDGSCIGYPGLPVLDNQTIRAAISEAHRQYKLTIVHATTAEATKHAIDAGIDGLGHLFFDRTPTSQLIEDIASSGAFIIPTLVTLSSAFGNDAAWLAKDERVRSKLSDKWLEALSRSMNVYPQGKLEEAYATIRALKDAGVDILAGSDVAEPLPMLGGLAHGASLHHELQLLVEAGLKPIEALRAATSTPARRFGLTDRGRIIPGARADLILVDGDPLTHISDTLSVSAIWHRGVRFTQQEHGGK